ncbi:MAG TPA: MFS transporter [Rhodocyclaceae bacterium]|nr:MFS transporter [Rhodocyclaceae bacterium]
MPRDTMPTAQSARAVVALLCLAEALSMTGFAAFPSFLPGLRQAWQMSGAEAGFVAGAFFFGYVLAVPVLTGITDRLDARGVFVLSCALAAAGSGGFAGLAEGAVSGALFQALAGAGLAGSYMPGLKALTDRIRERADERHQARYIAFYTATFGIGTSLSLLLAGWLGALLPWRTAVGLLVLGPLLAGAIAFFGLAPQPAHGARHASWWPRFGPVLADGRIRAYVLGYGAHCWELFGLRSWLVAFIGFAAGAAAMPVTPTAAAAFINLLGLPASILGNEAAAAAGRRRWISVMMMSSGALCWLAGISAAWPWWLMLAILAVYFVTVMADSAALTAGLVAATPLAQRGAAMAVYSLAGFGAGFVSPLVFGAVLDVAGDGSLAWTLAFGSLGLGCLAWAAVVRGRERAV